MNEKRSDVHIAVEMDRTRQIAAQLNGFTDTLTSGLVRAEESIRELKLGVPAYVMLTGDEVLDYGLGFERMGDSWKLVLLEAPVGDDGWHDRTPLINAKRAYRILAASKLGELVVALRKAAEAELSEVSEAAKEVNNFLSAFGVQS